MSDVVVFGAGVISEVVYSCLSRESGHRVVGFTVDRDHLSKREKFGLPMVPLDEVQKHFPCDRHEAIVAIGYHDLNAMRAERCKAMKDKGYRLISHCGGGPGGPDVAIGENAFVMDWRSVQPGVSIGDDAFVWSGATVGHHSEIGAHCWITTGSFIGGNVKMGNNCFIGLGAVVGHDVELGEACFLGAGSQVTRSAAGGSVFIVPDTEKYRLTSDQFLRITRMR